jgi:putative flippase GtrA
MDVLGSGGSVNLAISAAWPRRYLLVFGAVVRRTMLSGLETALTDRVPERYHPLVRVRRLRKFVTTGAVGVGVELLVLAMLVEMAVTGRFWGGVVGKEAAVFVMFAMNETWTVADSGRPGLEALGRRLLLSNMARAMGNGVALAVYAILYMWLGVWYLLAAPVGITVGFLFNYLLEGLWTWQSHMTAR